MLHPVWVNHNNYQFWATFEGVENDHVLLNTHTNLYKIVRKPLCSRGLVWDFIKLPDLTDNLESQVDQKWKP